MKALSTILKAVLLSVFILTLGLSAEVHAQAISGFSPLSITAGTESQLTINGSGFGAGPASAQRYVEFANADDGGFSFVRPALTQYISWSDNQIVVVVPSGAATGSISVVNSTTRMTSVTELKVSYNIINGGTNAKRHISMNAKGGYTYQFENSFNALAAAKNSFNKSLKAWFCHSGINWEMGLPTPVNVAGKDGVNVVRFDSGGELPAGVLGVAYTYSSACGNGSWEIDETDIVFDKETNWNFSDSPPNPSQSDFQSVALHELGHAHNLGHVNDANDLMHYAIAAGTMNRTFSASNLEGSTYQMNLSKVSPGGNCSPAMIPLTSPTCNFGFPAIQSVTPLSAGLGYKLTIDGEYFTGATALSFGGTAAASFSVISDKVIEATVGSGFTGQILLTAPGGVVAFDGFTFLEPPAILGFAPVSAYIGDKVTITGTNLLGLTEISFGGIAAASFTVVDGQHAEAIVGNGASGDVYVKNQLGSSRYPGFTFTPKISIASISPMKGITGDEVTINGSGFNEIKSVKFGGVDAASFSVVSENKITAVLGAGASGAVIVTSAFGDALFNDFTFVLPPQIASFTPESAASGGTVKINGQNFTDALEIKFGNIPAASFIVNSANLITATLGEGESGKVLVKTPGGVAYKDGFTFIQTLKIKSFAPLIGTSGDKVIITGSKFNSVVEVTFGGTPARSFTVDSPTQITAVIGSGTSGAVTVRTSDGIVTSPGFTFILPPTISYFTPVNAGSGATVTITGTNFNTATAVTFGGTPVLSFKILSSTTIEAVVATGTTGAISVTTPAGSAAIQGFTFIPPPVISRTDPASAGTGAVINIYGSFLATTKSVTIGDIPAASVNIISSDHLVVIVPNGIASGRIKLSTLGGTVIFDGFRFIEPPVISSFAPKSAIAGVEITLSGRNLADITRVDFGGVPASSFKVISDNVVTAVVSAGSNSGDISVVNPAGKTIASGFDFIFTLPSSNFKIAATDVTCKGAMTGIIKIDAVLPLNYIVTLTSAGTNIVYPFSSSLEVKNLAAGSYTVCISVEGKSNFKQCFETVVKEPLDLAVYSTLNKDNKTLNLKMQGGTNYYIVLNGKTVETSASEVDLDLYPGNNTLTVYTDKICQGVIERSFLLDNAAQVFPNPFLSELKIAGLPDGGSLTTEIADMAGKIVFAGKYFPDNGVVTLNLALLAPGKYILRMSAQNYKSVQKILKL